MVSVQNRSVHNRPLTFQNRPVHNTPYVHVHNRPTMITGPFCERGLLIMNWSVIMSVMNTTSVMKVVC